MEDFEDGEFWSEEYIASEDFEFVCECIRDCVDEVHDLISMLKDLSQKAGKESSVQIVVEYLQYAGGSLINADEDLTNINFQENCDASIKDYCWKPDNGKENKQDFK